jgi:anti-anti-sigma regulatory factor
VVLGRAGATGPFSGDAYLAARPPKSLLCLAMVQKGRLAGILYLENHVANEAFTPERVELCSLLASQAAIAVENALLIDELQRRTAELDKSNKALEVANQVLRTTNQDLAHERAQAEAAREALKDELYRLKTPLIPITSRIMVMPLIGTINAERGQQILEAALEGVSANRAAVVILDVTGVQAIDGGVTGTVLHIAGALRLLGAQAVITGIRPALARELVLLNQNVGDLVTRGTLESGIAYAMSRLAK